MKATDSYYPIVREINVTQTSESTISSINVFDGITVRNKLAHDYYCEFIRKYNDATYTSDIDVYLNKAFKLADKFIERSKKDE